MRVDWCVSSWFRIKNSLSLSLSQFEIATHQVVEWLPVRISLGPGFDWLHEAKWVEKMV